MFLSSFFYVRAVLVRYLRSRPATPPLTDRDRRASAGRRDVLDTRATFHKIKVIFHVPTRFPSS